MARKKKKPGLFSRAKRSLQERKIKKLSKKGVKVTHMKKPGEKKKSVSQALKDSSPSGKIRRGAKKVKLTKGGAYASYEKKSKPAKSFRAAFKSACGSSEEGSFSWDGRSYSCKRAKPSKKQKAKRLDIARAKALPGGLKNPRASY